MDDLVVRFAMASKALLCFLLGFSAVAVDAIQSRVVNGDNAVVGQFPWMVSLRSTFSSAHFCGGSLYTNEHVITAAHCVIGSNPSSIYVVTGHVSNAEGGRVTQVSEVRLHTGYNASASWVNDIAILKLATPILFTATEHPIPLASVNTPHMQSCVVSGWGRIHFPSVGLPARLQTQRLNAYGVQECRAIWGETRIYNSTLCAMSQRGEGVCSGDSGGPLVCNNELAGVVSWGSPCANGVPDMFARVYEFRDWIAEHTADRSIQAEAYEAMDNWENLNTKQ